MEGNFIKQDMTTLIQKTIIEVSSLLSDKKISIKVNTKEHFDCAFDQQLITRVLINLFSNAIKFSPENSILTDPTTIKVLSFSSIDISGVTRIIIFNHKIIFNQRRKNYVLLSM